MGATAAIAIASTALSGYQTISGFETQQRQSLAVAARGKYQSNILEQDATLADAQAQDALERGQIAEQRVRLAGRQQLGSTRAALAAQGVDISMGSAADVQASEAGLTEIDALTTRNNAAREAYGYKVDAMGLRQQAKLALFGANNEAAALRTSSYATLVTGGLQTAAYGIQAGTAIRGGRRGPSVPSVPSVPSLPPTKPGWK
jgi:hypothetical protein